ncbi:family 16 glycosylhydrolase [Aquimarina sp. AU119]|uniref:family 16 glycosylhydrolase n=1 Tax=Aquimarina sp. AU119 TaxID=2108528 RepID=UPI000D695665|nr:family 16 glycosylhydrolase [Aquimarina sp. AU119]
MKKFTYLLCTLLFCLVFQKSFAQPAPPNGKKWEKIEAMSDEFNGNSLNTTKWDDQDPQWQGRRPARFEKSSVKVGNGNLQVTASKKSSPSNGWTHNGGLVRSKTKNTYGYYEARMKANKTFMSSTFWLFNKRNEHTGCDVRTTELDVTENVGLNTGGQSWINRNIVTINSNTHSRGTTCNSTPVGIKGAKSDIGEPAYADYHTYGVWWKGPKELLFYLDGKLVHQITPVANFNLGMYLRMVVETYDWNPPKAGKDGMNDSQANRTTFYDWVRSYKLVDCNSNCGNPDPDPTPNTVSIDCNSLPSSLTSSTSIEVPVKYTADQNRDVVVELWNSGWLGQGKKTVSAGSGTTTVTINLNNAPASGTNYVLKASVRPVGGTWQQNIKACSKNDVTLSVVTPDPDPDPNPTNPQTVSLSAIDDAYLQGSTRFNTTSLRTENGRRVSYLKFNVSDIKGTITDANLKLTVSNDAGSGNINVNAGNSNTWTENNLSTSNAPGVGLLLGNLNKTYSLNQTQNFTLSNVVLNGNFLTLVVTQTGGNDVSFASDESQNGKPVLTITYNPSSDPNPNQDPSAVSVDCNSLPSSLTTGTSIEVPVTYTADQNRDVVVELWNSGWLGQGRKTVEAGSGTTIVTINLNNAPATGSNYLLKASVRPVGAGWQQNIKSCSKNNITLSTTTPDPDPVIVSIDCSSLPSSLNTGTSIEVPVKYSADQNRDVVIELWNSGWLGQGRKTVGVGSGTTTVTINLNNAPAAGSNYLLKASVRPVGAGWQQNIKSCSKNNITLSANNPGPNPSRKNVLFVRGGNGSGGFLEGGSNEQLADITNFQTFNGNHGWGTFAEVLRNNGYTLTQVTEGGGGNAAVNFANMNLAQYDIIVLGSNNAFYNNTQVNAIDNWVRNGGGLLTISDANFGSSWCDAPNSDQNFLSRYGIIVNQDQGTYALRRTSGDFVNGSHPILNGVNVFDGEGVSPFTVENTIPTGVTVQRLVKVKGNLRQNNRTGGNCQGTSRGSGNKDAVLVVASAGSGRVVGHYDRNTFFNQNGAGTNINRFDNKKYALNIFNWLMGNANARSFSINSEETIENSITVYPNPSIDITTINGLKKGDHIQVYSSLGKEVLNIHASSERESIEMSALPSGVYIISIAGKNKIRLLKQ